MRHTHTNTHTASALGSAIRARHGDKLTYSVITTVTNPVSADFVASWYIDESLDGGQTWQGVVHGSAPASGTINVEHGHNVAYALYRFRVYFDPETGSGSLDYTIKHDTVDAVVYVDGTSHTVSDVDIDRVLYTQSGSATTITVPVTDTIGIGESVEVVQGGAGLVSFAAASGATLRAEGGKTNSAGQYAHQKLTLIEKNVWLLSGNIAAPV